ncbi:extracellular solute-binding protein [Falsiroseomonas ponticola]|uniref:extracellular solute-binding protein n=1 Tax=Falsiroseomonas ponticola TaxID=2786951 RepID=UPI00193426A8|nr:extracellular solute-binding protein [Roseomonas ponticola]
MRRRAFLPALPALPALLARPLRAQADRVVMLGDAATQAMLSGGPGGMVAGDGIVWTISDTPHERALRDAGLAQGSYDLALLPHHLVTPRVATLFLPLEEAVEDIPPAFRRAFTLDGRLYGLPFAQVTQALFRNTAIARDAPAPGTAAAMLAACRAAAGRRPDGSAVAGLVADGPGLAIDLARLWDGDVLDAALALRVTEPAMLRGLEALSALFAEGALPRTLPRFTPADALRDMQAGRGAFALAPFLRHGLLNRPGASRDAGRIEVSAVPGVEGQAAPVTVALRALVIPRNAANPDGARRALGRLGGVEAAVRAGLNGNGPTRLAALADPRYRAAVPWAAAEEAAVRVARPALPPFAQAARAEAIIRAEVEAMLVRPRTAAETAERLAFRLRPLLA